jgi:hypothetical protein
MLLLVGVALAGCQSGLSMKPKGAAATGVPGVDAVAAKDATEKKDVAGSAPRIEPGDFAEGYRQPKGSLIPPRLPSGKMLPASTKK